MAFTVSARTILELGKELISSDDVALYELIKNSVDAKSPTITLKAQVVLPFRAYRMALKTLDDGEPADANFRRVANSILDGAPPEARSQFLDQLRGTVSDPSKYHDALVAAYKAFNWIEVIDTGHGMTLEQLSSVYLRLGTRSRRSSNVAGASYLGDKGVGRLSAMRLGERLQVRTTQAGEANWHTLDIDWGLFSHESDTDLEKVPIDPAEGEAKPDHSVQGTTVRVRDLATDWGPERFNDMVSGRIARLIDPFTPGRANQLLEIRFNGARVLVPSIPKSLLASAHAHCHVEFKFDEEGAPVLEGTIDYALRNAKRAVFQRGAEINSIAQNAIKRRGKKGAAATQVIPINQQALRDLGPFSCDIYWFNRSLVEAVGGLTETSTRTKDAIRQWAGGPMLYRHDFRVLPYGDPDDDWLELDRNAFGSSGFKLNRQQVIGQVKVTAGHTALSEQTNREGLIQSEPADALKTILGWLLHVEMRGLINDADKAETLLRRSAEDDAMEFRETQEAVEAALAALKARIPKEDKPYLDSLEREVTALAGQCAALLSRLDSAVSESREEREKFVHLAGIGLITEFIFHELDRAVVHTMRVLTEAQKGQREAALEALHEQLKTLQKRVSAFDELTGEKRNTKTNFDLDDVVSTVLESHANEFERHGVRVSLQAGSHPLRIRASRGMVIQILENLISNSMYWLKQQVTFEPGFKPQITITIDPDVRALTVEDNGGGVSPDRAERIFQPFVTSRPQGQGRGLGLYISRELADYHGWRLQMDPTVGRIRPKRLNMFVLDMGVDG
jgi:signal transduction histidine kinase